MLPPGDDQRFQELEDGGFTFACHPEVPCFNQCCRQLTLWLTPYDVLRLKNRLGMTSREFLDAHAEVEHGQNGWPMPRLKMRDDAEKTCPFVSEAGCTVYEDRPGACRTYPLGRATKGGKAGGPSEEGFFVVREEHCQGFAEDKRWSPEEWTQDQGLETYNHMNDLFMPLITRQAADANPQVIAQKMKMFMLGCYNLESFRAFVTQTRLTRLYDIDQARLEVITSHELELMKFAFQWLGFAIHGDATLELRPEVAAQRQADPYQPFDD